MWVLSQHSIHNKIIKKITHQHHFLYKIVFQNTMWLIHCVSLYQVPWVWRSEDNLRWFSPFSILIPGIELRSSSLVASTPTCWATTLLLLLLYYFQTESHHATLVILEFTEIHVMGLSACTSIPGNTKAFLKGPKITFRLCVWETNQCCSRRWFHA